MSLTNRAKNIVITTGIILALGRRPSLAIKKAKVNFAKRKHPQFMNRLRLSAGVAVLIGLFYGPMSGIAAAPTSLGTEEGRKITAEIPAFEVAREFKAVITQYSYNDSCHNVRNGKCLMASGKPVYVGAAACPTTIKLGTKVIVDGITYTCEDRYAAWLDDMRPHPTVDIFVSSNPRGRTVATVGVLLPEHNQ